MQHRSLLWRVSFVARKYVTVVSLLITQRASFKLNGCTLQIRNLSDIGTLQASILDVYEDIFKPGLITNKHRVLDIGANIGQFAHAIRLFYPDTPIESWEADPNIAALLTANTSELKKYGIYSYGLGSKSDSIKFYEHELSLMSSFQPYPGYKYKEGQIRDLPIKPLDSVAGAAPISFIKIDVEGFEIDVLKGAKKTIRNADYMLIELSLGRSSKANSNIEALSIIKQYAPGASIVKLGRPLGDDALPACQDAIIALSGA